MISMLNSLVFSDIKYERSYFFIIFYKSSRVISPFMDSVYCLKGDITRRVSYLINGLFFVWTKTITIQSKKFWYQILVLGIQKGKAQLTVDIPLVYSFMRSYNHGNFLFEIFIVVYYQITLTFNYYIIVLSTRPLKTQNGPYLKTLKKDTIFHSI